MGRRGGTWDHAVACAAFGLTLPAPPVAAAAFSGAAACNPSATDAILWTRTAGLPAIGPQTLPSLDTQAPAVPEPASLAALPGALGLRRRNAPA